MLRSSRFLRAPENAEAHLRRDGFGGVTWQRRHRHDREHEGHEGWQPEQGVATDFAEQEFMVSGGWLVPSD